jgi:glycosyltransferase involved in cell wall biosynthesis
MRLVFTSYSSVSEYDQPESWLTRINAYTGILEQLSKDHFVIGIERINYEGEFQQNGVQYYFLRQKKKVIRFPWRMHRLIKSLSPDIVFVNGFIFPLQIIQLRLKLGWKIKIIILHRAERPFKGLKKYFQKLADKCIDAYLFTSSEFGYEWRRNLDTRKIYEVIQASSVFYKIDKNSARQKLNINNHIVFLWVGSLTLRKDPLTVVKAFLQYVEFCPTAKLYMIYHQDDLLDEIKELLNKEVQYRSSVSMIGKIRHEQLLYWYNSSDFFVTGSHYEGTGVAVVEAMSCGAIPITTDFISFKSMTAHGKYGIVYEKGNQRALLSALFKTQTLDVECESVNVLRQFENELSFNAIAGKINKMISSLQK